MATMMATARAFPCLSHARLRSSNVVANRYAAARPNRGAVASAVPPSPLPRRKARRISKLLPLRATRDARLVAAKASAEPVEASPLKERLVTAGFIALWYAVNVCFNLTNKTVLKSFPFPWTVSTVHVLVGSIYCLLAYAIGFKNASFGRPITKSEWMKISAPASMHALGHIAANLSFAAVAISLTHTVKTLEPAFSVMLQYAILKVPTSLPVICSLAPIMVGVGLASAAELSFNWMGFSSAMISNVTFGLRAVLSKQTMKTVQNLSSTALYAYTTVISLLICAPLAAIMEGPALKAGAEAAIEKLGSSTTFYAYLFAIGIFYHLYNQFAFNTLARVSPVSHGECAFVRVRAHSCAFVPRLTTHLLSCTGVCNVVKRIIIIGSSVLFFGNKLTTQTMIGTAIALAGTAIYTDVSGATCAKNERFFPLHNSQWLTLLPHAPLMMLQLQTKAKLKK